MSITHAQPITLNVVDATPFARDVWSKRVQGIHGLYVELHTEAPAAPVRLAQGLWALVPDSFSVAVSGRLTAMVSSIPDAAQVMLVLGSSSGSTMRDVGSALVVNSEETDHAITRQLRSMVRTHRAERALAAALRFPAENPHPVLSFDRSGAVVYANPSASRLLDHSDEYGVTLVQRLGEQASCFEEGAHTVVELHDATYGFSFELDRETDRLNVYGVDITENLHAMECQMVMEKHSRNKDTFLAAMSHELRTPLNAVLSCAEAMKEGTYGALGVDQLEAVNTIEHSGKHLLTLISDILDISKIEAGRLEIAPAPMSVQSVCDAVMEIARVAATTKNISVSTTNYTALSAFSGDPLRIKQVLLNLVSNAIKFTPEYGEVGLDVLEGDEADTIVFRVWDTGPGISSVHADTIFKSFVQAGGDLANSQPGTGLGLTIARHLTRLHGGDLWLERLDGPGAVFIVKLPVGEATTLAGLTEDTGNVIALDQASPVDHGVGESEGDIERVLIAEDTDSSYQHLRDMLVSLGYTVDRAFNGQEAIEMCDAIRPDLVLMDIDMPFVNGIDAIREIRQDASHTELPIIAVTAMTDIASEQACLQAGANGFLAKPYPLRDLMMMMQRVSV